jgi:hypothetical protein
MQVRQDGRLRVIFPVRLTPVLQGSHQVLIRIKPIVTMKMQQAPAHLIRKQGKTQAQTCLQIACYAVPQRVADPARTCLTKTVFGIFQVSSANWEILCDTYASLISLKAKWLMQ